MEGGEALSLSLEWSGANPSSESGVVRWSIPQAMGGAQYELAMFDVAGRKLATLGRGSARSGVFAETVSFRANDNAPFSSGVFFLRLRIGTETLSRTVVLTR